jgi:hypothetical protein
MAQFHRVTSGKSRTEFLAQKKLNSKQVHRTAHR